MDFDVIDAYSELRYATRLRLISTAGANENPFMLNAHAICRVEERLLV